MKCSFEFPVAVSAVEFQDWEDCGDPRDSAEAYECLSCQWFKLCEGCCNLHYKKSHELVDYQIFALKFCPVHRRVCQLFCDTCYETICHNCLSSSHKKHEFSAIYEVAKKCNDHVLELTSSIEEQQRKLVNAAFEMDTQLAFDSALEEYDRHLDVFPGLAHATAARLVTEKRTRIRKDRPVDSFAEQLSVIDDQMKKLRDYLSLSLAEAVVKFAEARDAVDTILNEEGTPISFWNFFSVFLVFALDLGYTKYTANVTCF